MFLNVNDTRIKLDGILAYGPFGKSYDHDQVEYGVIIHYENTEVEIPMVREDISNWLQRLDHSLSK